MAWYHPHFLSDVGRPMDLHVAVLLIQFAHGPWARDEVAERALLMQELDRLEKLLTLTPKTAPERAAIVKRLAEAYAELARHAEYDRDVARIRAERAQQEEKANPKARRRPRAPTRM